MAPKREFKAIPLHPGNLNRYTADKTYAGRFPSSFLSGAYDYGTGTGASLRDPYNSVSKNRFEDTFRADKIAQRAIIKKVQFILSNKPSVTLDTNEEFATEELYNKALETVMSATENQKLLVDIKKINKQVKLHDRLVASEINKRVYGRSALGIVFKDNQPVDLKVFSSKNLGQVYFDKKGWKLSAVDYSDALVGKQKIPADEMLYFTHLDFHVTPDTLFYGLSELEGIAHDSETNRIISEEDLKETAKGHWAGVGVIKAPNITSASKLEELANGFDPGKWNAINADVSLEVQKIASDIDKISEVREQNDKRIIRGIDVPQPTMGYEDVTNRATMDTVMQVYHATSLDFERSMLRAQLEPQWYDSLTMQLLNIKDINDLKVKVKMEFEDLVFETFADKATPVLSLLDRGLITPERALRMMGLDDAVEEYEDAQKLQLEQQAEQMQQQADIQGKVKGGPQSGFGSANNLDKELKLETLKAAKTKRELLENLQSKVKDLT